ncbi:hypothetical protein AOC36_05825 [Erysipelothrix larvae]|uniref:Septation ring formation regulator EzrA n=1 Tax=Erysipelothrix larvae TaxID=1514105 RepID=A0A0X8H006_9FIRM|nr:septation ring formation regulator EzrA [Erysipelothrix larvae]AMC93515.1 hypothetical protein AOC36_05825 [Erysipelothrix larvae]
MLKASDIVNFIQKPIFWMSLLSVIAILAFVVGRRAYKKKQLKRQFERIEVMYNELISIPLSFKINKSNSLIKINKELEKEVTEIKAEYDTVNSYHNDIIALMGEVEDLIQFGKLSIASKSIVDLQDMLGESLTSTHDLDHRLNSVLEQETQQRVEITTQKDRFRKIKAQLMSNESMYADSFGILESQTRDIEQLFSTFEEWMFASDFEKAKELNIQISKEIDDYEYRINTIPKLYEKAKGIIPHLLDSVSSVFQNARSFGVYLSHLEVPKNIGFVSESLKEDLVRINYGDIERADENLDELITRLEQITEHIQKEAKSHEEMVVTSRQIYEVIDELIEAIGHLDKQRGLIASRFDIKDFESRLDSCETRIGELNEKRNHVVRMIDEEKIPATSIVIAIREITQDCQILAADFDVLSKEVSQANADELRARQQLMKLYLIINDVQVRIKRRSFPEISEEYEQDVRHAKQYARQVNDLLDQEVLDVGRLNATVAEAIDFTYKLHNNVNNLVGVVDMCENAIVYANRYRAYIAEIDTELTRAEIAFNNGEYTQSLKTIIQTIDKYRPDGSYEELIQKNAQSAK